MKNDGVLLALGTTGVLAALGAIRGTGSRAVEPGTVDNVSYVIAIVRKAIYDARYGISERNVLMAAIDFAELWMSCGSNSLKQEYYARIAQEKSVLCAQIAENSSMNRSRALIALAAEQIGMIPNEQTKSILRHAETASSLVQASRDASSTNHTTRPTQT